jgi:hypothetical protein
MTTTGLLRLKYAPFPLFTQTCEPDANSQIKGPKALRCIHFDTLGRKYRAFSQHLIQSVYRFVLDVKIVLIGCKWRQIND